MKDNVNFPLRLINSNIGELYSEEELQQIEQKIKVIQDNQKHTGLTDYPEIQERLKYCGESLIEISKDDKRCLGNLLSHITTLQSLIDIQVRKLKKEYDFEGEKIKNIINNP